MPTNNAINNQLASAPVSVPSATTTLIGAAGSMSVIITGTATITAFDTASVGQFRFAEFAASAVLVHHAATLKLPNNGANITTSAGDTAVFVSEGAGVWRCTNYTRYSGAAPSGANLSSRTTGEPTGAAAIANIVSLTQAQYNAGSPNATTLYLITE